MAVRKRTAPDYTSGVWERLRQQHIKEIEKQISKLEEKGLIDASKLKNVDVKELNKLSLQQVNEILNKSDYRKITSSTVKKRIEERRRILKEFREEPLSNINSHERFTQIMDQTSKAQRDEIRELDSDDVFRIGEQLLQEKDKTGMWTYDDFKDHMKAYKDIGEVFKSMDEGTFNNYMNDGIIF